MLSGAVGVGVRKGTASVKDRNVQFREAVTSVDRRGQSLKELDALKDDTSTFLAAGSVVNEIDGVPACVGADSKLPPPEKMCTSPRVYGKMASRTEEMSERIVEEKRRKY